MFVEIELRMANQSDIRNTVGPNFTAEASTNGSVEGQLVAEPQALWIIRIFLYVITFFIGVVGNVLVLLVVYKTPSLHSVTGYMIANLAVADLMVALFCLPATLIYSELKTWPFGYAMCKIIPFVQAISVMGSVGTLTIISIDRYRCIVNTFAARLSKSVLRYLVALIWSVALVPAFPLLGVNKLTEKSPIYCEENWPKPQYRTVYNTVSFALTYVIPLGIMSLLYIKIAIALNKVVKEGGNREGFTNQKKKDKVLRMLLALVIAYATCFLPTHVLVLWDEYGDGGKNRYWDLIFSYAILLVYVNSASNPVLYAFIGNRFKDGFKRLLCCRKFPKFNRALSRNNRQSAVATKEFGLSERSS